MRRPRIARPLIWLAATALLLWPVAPRATGRVTAYLRDGLHFPLLAGLTATLLIGDRKTLPGARRVARAAALVLPFLALIKGVQPWVGREREFRDVGLGVAGAATSAAFYAGACLAPGDRRRGIFRGLGLAGLSAALLPLAVIGMDHWESKRSFPVLASGVNRLHLSRAQLSRTPGGRAFDLKSVVSLGLFFGTAGPGDTVFVEEVRLLLPAAASAEPGRR